MDSVDKEAMKVMLSEHAENRKLIMGFDTRLILLETRQDQWIKHIKELKERIKELEQEIKDMKEAKYEEDMGDDL